MPGCHLQKVNAIQRTLLFIFAKEMAKVTKSEYILPMHATMRSSQTIGGTSLMYSIGDFFSRFCFVANTKTIRNRLHQLDHLEKVLPEYILLASNICQLN